MSSLNINVLSRRDDVVRLKHTTLALAILLGCASIGVNAATFPLGEAGSFGALASQTLTCTGGSAITGDVGLSPGTSTSIIGFPPCSLTGTLRASDLASPATQARADAATAFIALAPAAMAGGTDISGQDLGVINLGNGAGVLTPGVYTFTTSGSLTGTLTLDGQGQVDPLFVFQFGSAFTSSDAGANMVLTNGAVAGNIFFQVGSSATIGTGNVMSGTFIADQSVTLKTGASLNGRAIGLNASVTLDGNAIVVPAAAPPPPGPVPGPINNPPGGLLSILGELCEGEVLTASSTLTDADGLGVFRYQWFVNNAPVSGATEITFVPNAQAAGQSIRVEVSYRDGAGNDERVSSAAAGPVCAQKRVLFVNPADNPNQQTFLRFINPNPVANVVTIVGHDDSGNAGLDAQMTLALPAQTTMQLNASDLELGNAAKGLTGRLGDGTGKWQLKLNSPEPIVVMSLIRTPDGFLTSVSESAPRNAMGKRVLVTANPFSNQVQQGFIRVVNSSPDSGMVFVSAIDDAGVPAPGGELEFELGPFQSLNFNSVDYTLGNLSKGLVGALGEGVGAWHFSVRSTLNVGVMGLIRTPDGFVTNLSHSAPRDATDASADRMMFTVNPGSNTTQQSMIRLVNNDAAEAIVVISGIDDSGTRARDTVWVTLPPNTATDVLPSDLEQSNPAAGVFSNFGGFGTGTGDWQVTVSEQEESNVDAQSLMLVPGGFLTNLSGTVPQSSQYQAKVWIVNPGSNTDQRSVLRIVNRSDSAGAVLIEAIDDAGVDAPGSSVVLALAPRTAIELTAQDLEQGNVDKGMVGALGDGAGKWRMTLSADVPINAQSQLTTPSGFLTDLSRVVE
ncbi:MAG: ice-binding family protein [Xanthomonadaceae bacterium]|nr:ice-binding family protein [Xanthomonadaceae bacterium]MDP2184994.1 ice-binding family protein [Xanthomonadales bacterium]MDZ4114488.1 ice-binding family protein [Xanthomonadaceae bacterium]MDZ4378478.1 ice-binding family protein [Xanthomonadaceae bacterium]